MKENTIGQQITSLRKKFGLTQEDLAIKLGYSKQTVSNWETGLKTPRMGAIQKISDLFNVSKSFIIEGEITSTTLTQINETSAKLEEPRQKVVLATAQEQLDEQNKVIRPDFGKKVPLVGTTAANPTEISYGDTVYDEYVDEDVPSSADRALVVQGDSMEPDFPNGSIVFYRSQPEVENGELAIVEIEGNGVTFKKVYFNYDEGVAVLRSLNEKYADREIDVDLVKVIGKIVR